MKYRNIILTLAALLFVGTALQAQRYGRGRNNTNTFCCSCIEMQSQEISEKEKETLIYLREEEKLARDIYQTLYEKWNFFIFKNISNSEQKHTNAVKQLLAKYNIEDPVSDDAVGVFSNKALRTLYLKLVAKGKSSLVDAFIVGATIEDLDIFDLNTHLNKVDNEDIICVFNNLKRGSENHMRAFYRQIVRNGAEYKAQYISQQKLENILDSDSRRGRRGFGRRSVRR